MKRFRWMVLAGLLLASSARAITFGVGCANPCGQEVIAQGGTAVCAAVLANVDPVPVTVDASSTVTVSDLDGADVLAVTDTTQVIPPGGMATFPVTIAADALDVVGESIAVSFRLEPLGALAGSRLTVVASDACTVTTTTTPSTVPTTTIPQVTTTTVPSPTTTIPASLRPECEHSNGHGVGLLRKCGNLR